jgi:hypothetical protein
MWRWARENNNRFFEHLLPKALAIRNKTEAEEESYREEERRIEEIGKMARAAHRNWDEALAADVPGTIRESVRSALDCLARRYELSLPDVAWPKLAARMVELATKYIAAAMENPEAYTREKW